MNVPIDLLRPRDEPDIDDDALLALYSDGLGERWLRVNFVSSVDGAIVRDGVSGSLGGPADLRVFELLRRLCDVVLVAAGTIRAEGYGPMVLGEEASEARVAAGLAPHPVLAVVSNSLDLDPRAELFTRAPVRPIVVTTATSPERRRAELATVADVLLCGEEALDVPLLLDRLAERGLARVHCEGGPGLVGALLAADAVDELCLTVSPSLEAGTSGRLARSDSPHTRDVRLAHVLAAEDTLLLRYVRSR
ncbi:MULTISPECIES: pyrimidine reductase family protein [unclassified Rathayibacter]|uniref:pyrimidine reductase family protein n=1 Tax=unclassified Rathayibacter TaxID=2609250 RepID=UPI00188D5DFF|nr:MULTISPECIES: pyrimidine reductase family protein [unclassified Rathayibacter]MBF4462484.1 pyrimidine reductase family protein [Rathayibacter sp. VKM Ac-2879]MBF4503473.1 pyrimidine reductase family protein [Rathayibacter sp. VKM Ac-2878]